MKRKYARFGDDTSGVYECANRKCRWQGTHEDMSKKPDEIGHVLICPKCGNEEFRSLIKNK